MVLPSLCLLVAVLLQMIASATMFWCQKSPGVCSALQIVIPSSVKHFVVGQQHKAIMHVYTHAHAAVPDLHCSCCRMLP